MKKKPLQFVLYERISQSERVQNKRISSNWKARFHSKSHTTPTVVNEALILTSTNLNSCEQGKEDHEIARW